jgi:hypothetical protein
MCEPARVKRLLSGAVGLAAVVLTAAPASAAHLTLADPTGDRTGRGLDLTGGTLRNLHHRVVVDVDVARSVRGDLIVSVDPRHGPGVRLVSEYRPAGHTRNLVLEHAFTDPEPDPASDAASGRSSGRVRCHGFRVRWSADRPTVRLIMPATCLDGGDYDAVRFAVLTERRADTDYLPDGAAASSWVARG